MTVGGPHRGEIPNELLVPDQVASRRKSLVCPRFSLLKFWLAFKRITIPNRSRFWSKHASSNTPAVSVKTHSWNRANIRRREVSGPSSVSDILTQIAASIPEFLAHLEKGVGLRLPAWTSWSHLSLRLCCAVQLRLPLRNGGG